MSKLTGVLATIVGAGALAAASLLGAVPAGASGTIHSCSTNTPVAHNGWIATRCLITEVCPRDVYACVLGVRGSADGAGAVNVSITAPNVSPLTCSGWYSCATAEHEVWVPGGVTKTFTCDASGEALFETLHCQVQEYGYVVAD